MIRLTLQPLGVDQLVASLHAIADGLPDRISQAVEALSEQLQDALQAAAPVGKPTPGRTRPPGTLRDSIRFDLDETLSLFFADDTAWFVIAGTQPHTIRGNPTLRFYWDKKGGWVTFQQVHHPGTRANDFRAPALDQTARDADAELEAIGDWLAEVI